MSDFLTYHQLDPGLKIRIQQDYFWAGERNPALHLAEVQFMPMSLWTLIAPDTYIIGEVPSPDYKDYLVFIWEMNKGNGDQFGFICAISIDKVGVKGKN
jgi:hypothetical protein